MLLYCCTAAQGVCVSYILGEHNFAVKMGVPVLPSTPKQLLTVPVLVAALFMLVLMLMSTG